MLPWNSTSRLGIIPSGWSVERKTEAGLPSRGELPTPWHLPRFTGLLSAASSPLWFTKPTGGLQRAFPATF